MPVFAFAGALAQPRDGFDMVWVFIILHLLVYPASNGFNSYYDRDEESIGGLEKPPPVSSQLLWTSLFMDALALVLAFWVDVGFALSVFWYGLASKAYSYPGTRLKKDPWISWLLIGFFQGAFTFMMVYQGLAHPDSPFPPEAVLGGAFLSSWMLLGSYPMTQVYQHREDARRGDLTLSRVLGIRGTFGFTLIVFGAAGIAYFLYFWHFFNLRSAVFYQVALLPVILYFLSWMQRVWKDSEEANFRSAMRLNWLSAGALNLFFFLWWAYLGFAGLNARFFP